jgi:murein DD-endopeptidase MepM/ murein hydrolase activator NlpD
VRSLAKLETDREIGAITMTQATAKSTTTSNFWRIWRIRGWLLLGAAIGGHSAAIAPVTAAPLCAAGVLDQLIQHRVAPDETLDSIARRYRLQPATIMGFNPNTRNGTAAVGTTLTLPPYNGIRIEVPAGQDLKTLAARYKVRADVLFERNGCQANPRVVFIPGVNWSPNGGGTSPVSPDTRPTIAFQYPLAQRGAVLLGYGWKLRSANDRSEVALHSGMDLAAANGTEVLSAAAGTIAFVGAKDNYGQLIVINHSQGYQTRYAQLATIGVKLGQTVNAGQPIGTVGQTGQPSSPEAHLHFELRSNSKLGWVAEDPATSLK